MISKLQFDFDWPLASNYNTYKVAQYLKMTVLYSCFSSNNVSVIVLEHKKKGKSEKLIIEEPLTEIPHDWKKLPLNEGYKLELIRMIQSYWVELVQDWKSFWSKIEKPVTWKNHSRVYKQPQTEQISRVVLYCK